MGPVCVDRGIIPIMSKVVYNLTEFKIAKIAKLAKIADF